MRNIIIILTLFCIYMQGTQAQNVYYYYGNKKIDLQTITSKYFVLVDKALDTVSVKNTLRQAGHSLKNFKKSSVSYIFPNDSLLSHKYWTIVETGSNQNMLSTIDEISYITPYF